MMYAWCSSPEAIPSQTQRLARLIRLMQLSPSQNSEKKKHVCKISPWEKGESYLQIDHRFLTPRVSVSSTSSNSWSGLLLLRLPLRSSLSVSMSRHWIHVRSPWSARTVSQLRSSVRARLMASFTSNSLASSISIWVNVVSNTVSKVGALATFRGGVGSDGRRS